MSQITDADIAAVQTAAAHLDEIIMPTNEADLIRDPSGVTPQFDWEAIARTGFTRTQTVMIVRQLLAIAQHEIDGDVSPEGVRASLLGLSVYAALSINSSFPEAPPADGVTFAEAAAALQKIANI